MRITLNFPENYSYRKTIGSVNLTMGKGDRITIGEKTYTINNVETLDGFIHFDCVDTFQNDDWSYILKIGSKVVNIDHIINSGVIPSNRDRIIIDNVTYEVGFATYYSEEQIVEWQGYDLNNTRL